ncbi:hypothetical protein M9458_014075, partial [Cirrhinus mrigala]
RQQLLADRQSFHMEQLNNTSSRSNTSTIATSLAISLAVLHLYPTSLSLTPLPRPQHKAPPLSSTCISQFSPHQRTDWSSAW